jgi:hypothetical protein
LRLSDPLIRFEIVFLEHNFVLWLSRDGNFALDVLQKVATLEVDSGSFHVHNETALLITVTVSGCDVFVIT